MTVLETLQGLSTYPIPERTIQSICIARGLVTSVDFTLAIHNSKEYQLSKADVYMFLYTAPSLREQEVSITNSEKDNYKALAMNIYAAQGESISGGVRYGMIGEDYNG